MKQRIWILLVMTLILLTGCVRKETPEQVNAEVEHRSPTYEDLVRENQMLSVQMENLSEQIRELSDKNTQLIEEHDAYKETVQTDQALDEEKIDSLNNQIEQLTKLINDTKVLLARKEAELITRNNEITELKVENENYEERIWSLEQANAKLARDMEELKQRVFAKNNQ